MVAVQRSPYAPTALTFIIIIITVFPYALSAMCTMYMYIREVVHVRPRVISLLAKVMNGF
jgi:hypothetical protein